MRKINIAIGIAAILCLALAMFFVLRSEGSLVTHPKGLIAHKELELIAINYLLMLVIVVPTFCFFFWTVWKYRAGNKKAKYEPGHSHGAKGELILWAIPSVIVAVMSVITWKAAHELDPYRPISSDVKPLTIQVMALDWKWLFIYPEQNLASVNFVQFPAAVPIHLELSADGSPMNSFWIPELSGQIYSMTGMTTQLHIMADGPGVYSGRAAEINGEGFADMTFVAQSTTQAEFDNWVATVKQSPQVLSRAAYQNLVKPSQKHPVVLYSSVEEGLFNQIVHEYMHHGH